MKKINYTWKQLEEDCEYISKKLKNKKLKYVYGPPRGGCIFAVILSHKLNLKYLTNLRQKHTPIDTLIVDDVSDTGKCLKLLSNNKKYLTATAFIKTNTKFIPDIYCRETKDDIWINYPWEKI